MVSRALLEDYHAWNSTCGGGVKWSVGNPYINAITNELFLATATRLHVLTGGSGVPVAGASYREWAEREWAWLQAAAFYTAGGGLLMDGLDEHSCARAVGAKWTYNQVTAHAVRGGVRVTEGARCVNGAQGVVLTGLADLAAITGDARTLDVAAGIVRGALAYFGNGARLRGRRLAVHAEAQNIYIKLLRVVRFRNRRDERGGVRAELRVRRPPV